MVVGSVEPVFDPFVVDATASIACILAVAAAAAIAAAVGKDVGAVGVHSKQFGGVIARPTRRFCPARSK